MKKINILRSSFLGAMMAFSGCGSEDTSSILPILSPVVSSYTLNLTNLTAGQPMSPVLVTTDSIFSVGSSASLGLEKLAEGGDNRSLLNENGVSSSGLLTPGATTTVSITTSATTLSMATMLVKTNDAFAGVEAYNVSSLAINESKILYLNVYDAGTEANSETNLTVAAFGIEGFNATRDDSDMVTLHAGIISYEDGLKTSVLTAQEKFNNPAVAVKITRTK